jgi:2,4-dienoyl-CoA reductase-like NADH-dependent reductase (Old Yellow Enzyme family)
VASVNGWRSIGRMRDAVASGAVDMISLCRPLIREPDLVSHLAAGTRTRASCISCNECLKRQESLRCWADA